MHLPIRNSVRIILLNDKNELLLMLIADPSITSIDGTVFKQFWCLIGGGIEENETLQAAAFREIFEETGISQQDIVLGPVVWFGEFDMILADKPIRMKQQFIVARTNQTAFSLNHLTEEEKKTVRSLQWFSLTQIKNTDDIIYPVDLADYLAPIIEGKYPQGPIYLPYLGKKPICNSNLILNK